MCCHIKNTRDSSKTWVTFRDHVHIRTSVEKSQSNLVPQVKPVLYYCFETNNFFHESLNFIIFMILIIFVFFKKTKIRCVPEFSHEIHIIFFLLISKKGLLSALQDFSKFFSMIKNAFKLCFPLLYCLNYIGLLKKHPFSSTFA